MKISRQFQILSLFILFLFSWKHLPFAQVNDHLFVITIIVENPSPETKSLQDIVEFIAEYVHINADGVRNVSVEKTIYENTNAHTKDDCDRHSF